MRSKITNQTLIDEFISLLAMGNHFETACAAVGISKRAFNDWMAEGRAVEERVAVETNADDLRAALLRGDQVLHLSDMQRHCWVFRSRVHAATAMTEAYAIAMTRQAMSRDWLAALAYLEQRYPDRWRRRRELALPEGPASPIDVQALMADPQAMSLIHEALKVVSTPSVETLEDAQKRIGTKASMDDWSRPA